MVQYFVKIITEVPDAEIPDYSEKFLHKAIKEELKAVKAKLLEAGNNDEETIEIANQQEILEYFPTDDQMTDQEGQNPLWREIGAIKRASTELKVEMFEVKEMMYTLCAGRMVSNKNSKQTK